MSNDFDDATQLGSIGHNPSVPSQPGFVSPGASFVFANAFSSRTRRTVLAAMSRTYICGTAQSV